MDRTTVYVDPENGVVQEAIVEEYTDEDTYSENELEAFVQEDAAAYNEEAGADSVTVSGVKVSGDEVRILLRYADSSAYAGYHLTDFFLREPLRKRRKRGMIFQEPCWILRERRPLRRIFCPGIRIITW